MLHQGNRSGLNVPRKPTFARVPPTPPVWRAVFPLALGLLACSGLGPVGCATSTPGTPVVLASQSPWSSELSIAVDNDLGEVSIEVDSTLAVPVVQVRRFGDLGGNSMDAAEGVTVVREGGTSGQTLRVVAARVTYPAAASFLRPTRRALSIDIRTPPVFGVLVQNSGGAVRLAGVAGPIQVNNGIGDRRLAAGSTEFVDRARIVLRTDQPLREPIDLTSGEGGIELEIPEDSDLELSIAAAKGGTSVHAANTAFTAVHNDPDAWSGKLGDASAPAHLKAGGGSAQVNITPVRTRRPPR